MLELTNLSGHTCTLIAYSGVSAVNLRGRQLGKAASRTSSPQPKLVTLADGATAALLSDRSARREPARFDPEPTFRGE
jgi:Protein of unknown function (DUF4232)